MEGVIALVTKPEFLLSLIVALVAASLITLTQIVSTYPGFELDVHTRTGATAGLYVVNGVFVLAILVAAWVTNPGLDWWTAGFSIGVGLPVIVQSKFTITKPLGDKGGIPGGILGDVSLDIGSYYRVYAGVFRRGMDSANELAFQTIFTKIAARFTGDQGLQNLKDKAYEALDARNLLSDERQQHDDQIQKIMVSSRSVEQKKRLLAREILSLMGRKYLERLA